jgi:NAD+ kinase
MTSTSLSTPQLPRVETAAVVSHARKDVHEAVDRVRALAERCGVAVVEEPRDAQLVIALGGDGTILRTLAHLLGSGVPVLGVNLGRVGFLATIAPERMEQDLERVLTGDYRVVELPTLELQLEGGRHVAVNDVVATSSTLGRMVELAWSIDGEDLGTVPCDGMICSTPSGSTAYNLSNGGPVLVRGLDAMAITFIAPHSLHARPLVVARGQRLTIRNATADVGCAVLVDGRRTAELEPGASAEVYLCEQRTLLATLPEVSFFRRYREVFAG